MNTINYVLAIVTFDGQTKYLEDKDKTGGEGFTTNQHFVKLFKTRKQAQKEAAKHETKYFAYPVNVFGEGLFVHI